MDNLITFMHLSDIHFTKESNGALDLDHELRSKLEIDAEQMKNELGNIQGILVTGDIAYSGHKDEYSSAIDWLGTLSEKIGCEKQKVWVTPGNHDVIRNVVDESKALTDQHKRFRNSHPASVDKEIWATFKDKTYSKLIFEPIESYIKFASKFSCDIGVNNPTWEDDIYLNDDTVLRLNGLNSTITSDKFDDDKANKLILGSHQTMMIEKPNIIHMTLCHHPPDWLIDKDNVIKALLAKAKIQLFGHKHSQILEHINNGEGLETLKIISGAVHPERKESDWRPCYNYLSLSIDETADDRFLKVFVYQRLWNSDISSFESVAQKKNNKYTEFQLKLPSIPKKKKVKPKTGKTESKKNTTENIQGGKRGESAMDPKRELAYKFLTLPYHDIMEITVKLGLLKDQDENLMDFEIFEKIFKRAESSAQLRELWIAVFEKHGEEIKFNPF